MTGQDFARVKEIFLQACDLAPSERAAFLDRASAGDPATRAEVESLLASDEHLNVSSPATGAADCPPGLVAGTVLTGIGTAAGAADALVPGAAAPRQGLAVAASPVRRKGRSSEWIYHGRFIPGTLLGGRYRIVALLGEGGMGEVYRADDLKLGQTVALKFLPEALARDPRSLARFQSEVRLARQISHPNICRVYDIAETDGHHFLSMEYVDGEDLASLLRRVGRFPPDRAAEVAQQLCSGLAAAHERGVLHLDLKPANVMIDGRGQVIIHDFGLASLVEQIPGNPVHAGTPGYMAPEQWAGGRVTTRTDLYSLGLVLYEVFTGRAAFPDETLSDLLRRDPRGTKRAAPAAPSTLVDGMDPAVERVIQRCLIEDPRQRPESVLEVMSELPGGDPLAAAMRSGKTLSPEMVAASPGGRPLTPIVAAAVFLLGAAGIVANVVLAGRLRVLERLTIPKPTDVMVDRAEGVIQRLGYGQKRAYSAWGFDYNLKTDGQVVGEAEARERARAGAEAGVNAATEVPPGIVFWYRQAATPLVPSPTGVDFAAAKATYDDPPPLAPGMTSLKLDSQGRLTEFVAVQAPVPAGGLPPKGAAAPPVLRPDWQRLLAEAQLELAELTDAAPAWAPPVACDARVAWEATFPGQKQAGTRVEAGARDGKVVWFRVLRPADVGEASYYAGELWKPPNVSARAGIHTFISTSIYVATLLGGGVLAYRNLRLARADRKGTARLAVFVFCVFMLNWALAATHANSYTEEFFNVALPAVAKALLWTGALWVCYVALEPHVRRIWPHRLVSWTRLLNGRWHDPLVGRDVLIGAAAGIVLVPAIGLLDQFGAAMSKLPERVPMGGTPLQTLLGVRFVAERVGITAIVAIHWAMLFLFVPVLIKLVVRNVWLAIALAFVIWTTMALLSRPQVTGWDILCQSLATAVPLFIAIRYGFLSIAAACFGMFILWNMPITSRYTEWYSGVSLFAILLLAALLTTGLYFAVRVKTSPAIAPIRPAPELA